MFDKTWNNVVGCLASPLLHQCQFVKTASSILCRHCYSNTKLFFVLSLLKAFLFVYFSAFNIYSLNDFKQNSFARYLQVCPKVILINRILHNMSVKKRKYNDSYIEYGFTCIIDNGVERHQCVICNKVLSHDSLKPTKLIGQSGACCHSFRIFNIVLLLVDIAMILPWHFILAYVPSVTAAK